jgi:beta-N-acetylhexosaminidase
MSSPIALTRGGQFLIIGIPGPELDADTREAIKEIQPAGFILFGRNIASSAQLRHLTEDLRACVQQEPIITIDQEGGRVSRLKEIGHEPPSARQLREKQDIPLIEHHGRLTGQLLRLFGFNLDLCPVLDVSFDDEADNSLKNRTYGKSPEAVIAHAGAFNRGLRGEGILSCGKHFPGYSAATVDPHHDLPLIDRTAAQLSECEWRPYRALLPELDSLMVGHVRNLHLDSTGMASSISYPMVQGILREAWNYSGVVLTDDMDMGAILNEYGFADSLRRAIRAGNDLILLCHRIPMAREAARALGELTDAELAPAQARLTLFRQRLAPPTPFSLAEHRRLDAAVYALREAVLGSEAATQRSTDEGKRSPVETY